jgi:maltooligosyltrehalose trehalohydrolase
LKVELRQDFQAAPTYTATLAPEADGYFSGVVEGPSAGWLYGFHLDGEERLLPDPASRFQPQGPDGLSQIIDPADYRWTDAEWPGVKNEGQVIYELHIGTFTPEGTWRAAIERLPQLADLGITLVEVMPVADFPGKFGWGYDGVSMFAPTRLYGEPNDFRAFVDRAHALGLGVILDVVYNHFGNIHNFIYEYAQEFRSQRYDNEWGDALNFDGAGCAGVRSFFETNARCWIGEFHLDGFRFDATQSIHDASKRHVLGAITCAARQAANGRSLFMAAENEPQDVRTVRPVDAGGHGMDAVWNDDFHHSAQVCVTGKNPAYYSDYEGSPQELITAALRGFIYQGQPSQWQKKPRGTPTKGLNGRYFVSCLQNHDQVANSATGARLHLLTSPGRYRAMTAFWLLAPHTPLFFQGQEYCASTPFLYFADPPGDAPALVAKGRGEFMSQFPNLAREEDRNGLALPHDPATFERCKLDWDEREQNGASLRLHQDLLRLRREDPVIRQHDMLRMAGAVLGPRALALRYFGGEEDRLLLANFGAELRLSPCPEALLAPPEGRSWSICWHSEQDCYEGLGIGPVQSETGWHLPGEAVVLLKG